MPQVVDQLPLGPLATNCYVVRADRARAEAVVVDPSGSATEIRLGLASRGTRCAAILVTHGHFDHVLGLADLAEGTGAPVHAPAGELRAARGPGRVRASGDHAPRPWTPDVLLEGGETLELAGMHVRRRLRPRPLAGTPRVRDRRRAPLGGRALCRARSAAPTSRARDWETLLESIRTLVDRYPADTAVHPGHGPSTTLGEELARNPFLAELRRQRQEPVG